MNKYQIIYADPPWKYTVFGDKPPAARGRESDYYEVMDLLDIAALPVTSIAAEDSVLFMWATFPAMQTAMKLMRNWGFYYRTVGFVWVKRNKKSDSYFWGMGGWTRSNAEVCLIGTRGNLKRVSRSVHQVIDSPIRGHSQKPPETRDRIVELMRDKSRIELFARERVPGWDAWGDEVASDVDLSSMVKDVDPASTPPTPNKEVDT